MRGIPFDLTEYPPLEANVTDTVRPQKSIIPIYYFHSFEQPYCRNPECKCHRRQQEVRRLLDNIIEGKLTLRQAADLIDDKGIEG